MQKAVYILLAGLCLFVCTAHAQQDARAITTMEVDRIQIGDRANVVIELRHRAADRVEWNTLRDTFNSLEVLAKSPIDTVQIDDVVTYRQQLQVTGFDSGVFEIPAFSFTVVPAGEDTPYIIRTEPIPLLVETVPVDTTQGYKGIKEIIYVEASWLDYAGWITAGIAVLILLALLIY